MTFSALPFRRTSSSLLGHNPHPRPRCLLSSACFAFQVALWLAISTLGSWAGETLYRGLSTGDLRTVGRKIYEDKAAGGNRRRMEHVGTITATKFKKYETPFGPYQSAVATVKRPNGKTFEISESQVGGYHVVSLGE